MGRTVSFPPSTFQQSAGVKVLRKKEELVAGELLVYAKPGGTMRQCCGVARFCHLMYKAKSVNQLRKITDMLVLSWPLIAMLHSGLWLGEILAVCHSIPFLGSSPVFVSQVYSHKNTFNVHHIKPYASFTWSDNVLEHHRVHALFSDTHTSLFKRNHIMRCNQMPTFLYFICSSN